MIMATLRLPTVPAGRQPHFANQLLRTCQATPNPFQGFGLSLASDGERQMRAHSFAQLYLFLYLRLC